MGGAGDAVSCTDSGRGDTDTPDGEIYTDNTGTDLTQFIISTLNKNAKDRVLMLKLEQEMTNLVQSILISKPGDSVETEFSGEGWEEDSP